MKTAEQIMERVLDELSREARTAEDKARLESTLRKWASLREQRERKELKILLLTEEPRQEDEQFAVLDE